MAPDQRPRPGRRSLVVAGLAGPLAVLSGCGIRLEDDAPRVPLVPTRTPVPGEDDLVALTLDCDRLAGLAAALPGTLAAALVEVHRRQATVLRTTLQRAGAPADALSAAPLSPVPTPTSSADVRSARSALAAAESAAAARVGRFVSVDAALRTPVAALHAQRWAAARLLGGDPQVPGLGGGSPSALSPAASVVRDLAAEVDGALYLLEVVTARTSGTPRVRADETRATLSALREALAAVDDPGPPAVGLPLPFPVGSADDARRLARETLDALRAGVGARLDGLLEDTGAAGLTAVTGWLGAVEAEARRWGLPLAPFPGLT